MHKKIDFAHTIIITVVLIINSYGQSLGQEITSTDIISKGWSGSMFILGRSDQGIMVLRGSKMPQQFSRKPETETQKFTLIFLDTVLKKKWERSNDDLIPAKKASIEAFGFFYQQAIWLSMEDQDSQSGSALWLNSVGSSGTLQRKEIILPEPVSQRSKHKFSLCISEGGNQLAVIIHSLSGLGKKMNVTDLIIVLDTTLIQSAPMTFTYSYDGKEYLPFQYGISNSGNLIILSTLNETSNNPVANTFRIYYANASRRTSFDFLPQSKGQLTRLSLVINNLTDEMILAGFFETGKSHAPGIYTCTMNLEIPGSPKEISSEILSEKYPELFSKKLKKSDIPISRFTINRLALQADGSICMVTEAIYPVESDLLDLLIYNIPDPDLLQFLINEMTYPASSFFGDIAIFRISGTTISASLIPKLHQPQASIPIYSSCASVLSENTVNVVYNETEFATWSKKNDLISVRSFNGKLQEPVITKHEFRFLPYGALQENAQNLLIPGLNNDGYVIARIRFN